MKRWAVDSFRTWRGPTSRFRAQVNWSTLYGLLNWRAAK